MDNYKNHNDYQGIIKHLEAYQRGGEHRRWEDYAGKIPPDIRELWRTALADCARNGFIAPYVFAGELIWRRIVTRGQATRDLCTLCRRECRNRDDIDGGEVTWRLKHAPGYEEPKKCWEDDTTNGQT